MDEFDVFNTTNEQNDDNNEENSSDNIQSTDLAWTLDDNLADISAPTQSNILFDGDDTFPVTSSNDNQFVDQSQPFSMPTDNRILNNDFERRSSDNSLSSNSMPKFSSSSNNLSALEEFNQRRQQEIAEFDVLEKQKIEELRQQGKRDLERWYEDRRLQMEQKRQAMKNEQDSSLNEALKKSDKQSCDWGKVIRFLDFSQGTQLTKQKRDLNRMRAVIVQAKRDRDNLTSQNGNE